MDHSGHDMDKMNMNNTGDCDGMGMMMYFHVGKCEHILFEKLYTTTVGEMVGACIVVFILAGLYEGLKVFREELLKRALTNKYTVQRGTSSSQDTIVADAKRNGSSVDIIRGDGGRFSSEQKPCLYMLSCAHFIQTFLHMFQVFISYCLMLVFMTYNAWLCIAVILGAGVGYFLFSWRRAVVVDLNEHCH